MKTLTRFILSLVLLVGLSAVVSVADTTDTVVFRTLLSPANEVPPVTGLDASGVAIVWVHVVRDMGGNITSGSVDFQVDYSFPGTVEIVGLHIHSGPAGVNAPVVISSGISGAESIMDDTGTGTIVRQAFVSSGDPAAFDAMVALLSQPDQFYVNLHTSVNPGGALRGQLRAADVLVVRAAMSPANEVPPVEGLDADGSASITIYATRDSASAMTSASVNFDVQYRFPGEVEIVGLHIHSGPAGVNAPVVISSGISGTNSVMDSGGAGTISRPGGFGSRQSHAARHPRRRRSSRSRSSSTACRVTLSPSPWRGPADSPLSANRPLTEGTATETFRSACLLHPCEMFLRYGPDSAHMYCTGSWQDAPFSPAMPDRSPQKG